jgi:hypothetical protein|tara:strand:- start:1109 stop:1258 length:150 start_codon:yes stop_codon:yes gene_type:complete
MSDQLKYKRLHHAQQLLRSSEYAQQLDRLEPVVDLTEATKYLTRFKKEK